MKATTLEKNGVRPILSGYRRKGKVLIPPMMQLPNLVETSFVDTKIPDLIWISALFNWTDDRAAVNCVIEFQLACREVIACDQFSSLSFLSNFDRLTSDQKNKILSNQACAVWIEKLTSQLWHHYVLLDRYPLSFIFRTTEKFDHEEAVVRLKKDVHELFDRRSQHATKVQTTAVAPMATSNSPTCGRSNSSRQGGLIMHFVRRVV